LGGSEKDLRDMRERYEDLIDHINVEELKEESANGLEKEIINFVTKIGKLVNKSSNKDFMDTLKLRVENLGAYNKYFFSEEEMLQKNPNTTDKELIEFENKRNRSRVHNLKNYINNYFRRYISLISNSFDPSDAEHLKEIKDVDSLTSREIQRFIVDRDEFLKKYLTKKDSDIFKKLQFDVNTNVISNISANVDRWDIEYKKVSQLASFNLSHLADSLLYILVKNLDDFISIEHGKDGLEKNKTIAQFIVEVLDRIHEDSNKLDFSPDVTYIAEPSLSSGEVGEEAPKDESFWVINSVQSKFKKLRNKTDTEEIYQEMEKEDKKRAYTDTFISKYEKKHGKKPSQDEIDDHLETMEKELDQDNFEEQEEYGGDKITDENDETGEIGEGYGAMAQGGEGEDGDF